MTDDGKQPWAPPRPVIIVTSTCYRGYLMASGHCDQCGGKGRHHLAGCPRRGKQGTPKGQRIHPRGNPRDIPKHTCKKEAVGTVTKRVGIRKDEVTTHYSCSICGKDMGSTTEKKDRLW